MTKYEWETELKKNIHRLPKEEQDRVLDFYGELFADKAESGMNETQIINEFGNPIDVADRIISEYSFEPARDAAETVTAPKERPKAEDYKAFKAEEKKEAPSKKTEPVPDVPEKGKAARGAGRTVAFVILLILFGFVGLGILITVWALVLSAFVCGIAFVAGGLFQVFVSLSVFPLSAGSAIAQIGISLFITGLGILLIVNFKRIGKAGVACSKGIYNAFIGWYAKSGRKA